MKEHLFGRGACVAVVVICGALGTARPTLNAEEIFVRANQVGYKPHDAKLAIAFSKSAMPGTFSVVGAADEKVVFTFFQGKTQRVRDAKWGQFENHVEMDFSGLKR